ncbi:unnamed protein product, partial [Phaeothamnion confervicola]
CTICHEIKSSTNFREGDHNTCRVCRSAHRKAYLKTKTGCLHEMVTRCKNNNSQRVKKGRDLEFALTYDDLVQIDKKQAGLCAISLLPLVFSTLSNWQASPDRINNSIGYTNDNVRLVALEFNTPTEWSQLLILDLISLAGTAFENYDEAVVHMTQPLPRCGTRRVWPIDIVKGKEVILCYFCNTRKPREDFPQKISSGCKTCKVINMRAHKQTWRGILQKLYGTACTSTKDRNKKGRNLECTITYEDIVQKFIEQKGMCAYSNVPLQTTGERMVSLERKKTNVGYIPGNICLICVCFNSGDRSDGVGESCGWSKEKWDFLVDHVETMMET